MKVSVVFVVFAIGLLCAMSAPAATFYIEPDGSGDASTIQAGIEIANAGDTVLLAAGTFTGTGNYNIDFLGKAITVTSESGPEVTVIDCEQNGRGFIFQNGEGLSSVLAGVTIQNGNSGIFEDGGAISCESASPTITGNIIQNNEAGSGGGGIACNMSAPEIVGNMIIGNSAPGQEGGGIWLWFSDAFIGNNVIRDNEASYGAGIYAIMNSAPQIVGNVVYNNSAFSFGGGILLNGGAATISVNVIYGNDANYGAGIATENVDGSTLISQNTLSENHAHSGTGGNIYASGSPTIEHTIMAYSTSGEGLYCNTPASQPVVTCCLIFGNAGGDALCGVDGGNNLFVDPGFCGTIGSHNYLLQSDSPCAPTNNPCVMLIGARDVGCGTSGFEKASWGEVKSLYR